VKRAAVRIAVSSSTFRRPLAAGELTQLEWLERCASVLGVDGVLADVSDFPRRDAEYVAQLRKVAIDLGLVPFGLDAPGLLDPASDATHDESRDDVLTLAIALGVLVIRTTLPPPGEVPPASFVEAVAAAKVLSRAAKAANITVLVAEAPGTLGHDLEAVKHLLKDVDSAWLRACPSALVPEVGARDRYPAYVADPADDPATVAARTTRSWLILDAPAVDDPWDLSRDAVDDLRLAEARLRLGAGR
jgi:hypothetical protein